MLLLQENSGSCKTPHRKMRAEIHESSSTAQHIMILCNSSLQTNLSSTNCCSSLKYGKDHG